MDEFDGVQNARGRCGWSLHHQRGWPSQSHSHKWELRRRRAVGRRRRKLQANEKSKRQSKKELKDCNVKNIVVLKMSIL